MATESTERPAFGLPRELGAAIVARRGEIVASVIAAVAPALPAFGDPDELPFAGGLQLAAESMVDELSAEIATGRRATAREIDYHLGRGQALAMRPLDELLAAYRIGGRALIGELRAIATERESEPDLAERLADAVSVMIDRYSVRAAAGYADGQLASTGAPEAGRVHLVRRLILRSADRDGWMTIARGIGWPVPTSIACVAIRGADWDAARSLPGSPPAGPIDELACVVLSGLGEGGRGDATVNGLAALPLAVVGPAVAPEEAPLSFGRAAALIRAGVVAAGAGLVRADDHLHELARLAVEPRVADDFVRVRLAPLDALGTRAAAKVGTTVRTWLSHQGRYEPAAAELGIHPQTVRYRISQAREAFGPDFDNPAGRDGIRFALQLRELGPAAVDRP